MNKCTLTNSLDVDTRKSFRNYTARVRALVTSTKKKKTQLKYVSWHSVQLNIPETESGFTTVY